MLGLEVQSWAAGVVEQGVRVDVLLRGQSRRSHPRHPDGCDGRSIRQGSGSRRGERRQPLGVTRRSGAEVARPEDQDESDGDPGGLQFRFMGQRYIADSEVLQNLPKWPERTFPKVAPSEINGQRSVTMLSSSIY